MNKEQIIAWAIEIWIAGEVYVGPSEKTLEQFASLAYAAGVKDENEACAKVCEELLFSELGPTPAAKYQRNLCAADIRARRNT